MNDPHYPVWVVTSMSIGSALWGHVVAIFPIANRKEAESCAVACGGALHPGSGCAVTFDLNVSVEIAP